MRLDYFTLLSPTSFYIENVGNIFSPKLKDISKVGIDVYNFYISLLLFNPKTYFGIIGKLKEYEENNIELTSQETYELFVSNEYIATLLQNAFNFFFIQNVVFYQEEKCFLVAKDLNDIKNTVIGVINVSNYQYVADLILQFNNIHKSEEYDMNKIKSKKALEIVKKIQKAKKQIKSQKENNENVDLGNIVSVVANKHPSINMTNIYDLTIYQLWDSYIRLINNNIYDIQSTNMAVWGNKDFDISSWTKKIDN